MLILLLISIIGLACKYSLFLHKILVSPYLLFDHLEVTMKLYQG